MQQAFYKPDSLLSISSDAKTSKGEKLGFLTGILYMSPARIIPAFNNCPMAEKAGCEKACLYTAGRGAMSNVQKGRINKTIYFYNARQAFMHQLVKDIVALRKKAQKLGLIPLVRLNGTQDIRWENIAFEYKGKYYPNIMTLFPDVQFYDYTKLSNRKDIPNNYDLTFSYSGLKSFEPYVKKAIDNGMRIAVVFKDKNTIPDNFLGLPTIPGDDSDIRHTEPKAHIVALYAKGKARQDNSGFVVIN